VELKAWYGCWCPIGSGAWNSCAWNFGVPARHHPAAGSDHPGWAQDHYRLLGYNGWLKDFFATFKRITVWRLGKAQDLVPKR